MSKDITVFLIAIRTTMGGSSNHPFVYRTRKVAELVAETLVKEWTFCEVQKWSGEVIPEDRCIVDGKVYRLSNLTEQELHRERGLAKLTVEEKKALFHPCEEPPPIPHRAGYHNNVLYLNSLAQKLNVAEICGLDPDENPGYLRDVLLSAIELVRIQSVEMKRKSQTDRTVPQHSTVSDWQEMIGCTCTQTETWKLVLNPDCPVHGKN